MKLLIFVALILLFAAGSVLYAQPDVDWQRVYGGGDIDGFFSHIRCENDNWAFAGYSFVGNTFNVFLVVTDPAGVYFIDVRTETGKETRRIVLVE